MILNFIAFMYDWDMYPFVLLNFLFSMPAAYAAPIIMMSQNRQNERDRMQAQKDYQTNTEAKEKWKNCRYSQNVLKLKNLTGL